MTDARRAKLQAMAYAQAAEWLGIDCDNCDMACEGQVTEDEEIYVREYIRVDITDALRAEARLR